MKKDNPMELTDLQRLEERGKAAILPFKKAMDAYVLEVLKAIVRHCRKKK